MWPNLILNDSVSMTGGYYPIFLNERLSTSKVTEQELECWIGG